MTNETEQVEWLHVIVPDSAVPELLRRGLELMARATAQDLRIPTPRIHYFQGRVVDDDDARMELEILWELLASELAKEPEGKREGKVVRAFTERFSVSTLPRGIQQCGHVFSSVTDTLWLNTQRPPWQMADTLRHEMRHLYQAHIGMGADLEPEERTKQHEADAEAYADATNLLTDNPLMQRAWRAFDRATEPLHLHMLHKENPWVECYRQVVFPTKYDDWTLYRFAGLGAETVLAIDAEAEAAEQAS